MLQLGKDIPSALGYGGIKGFSVSLHSKTFHLAHNLVYDEEPG